MVVFTRELAEAIAALHIARGHIPRYTDAHDEVGEVLGRLDPDGLRAQDERHRAFEARRAATLLGMRP
jgi:catechol 2,3-dioxygenase-like lactoylglutathione lyase family enzyme